MDHKPEIEHVVLMGDSLSDEGTMWNRKLFGLIPMRSLSGLDKSPHGRFNNGFNWADLVFTWLCDEFTGRQLRKQIEQNKQKWEGIKTIQGGSPEVDALIDNPIHKKSKALKHSHSSSQLSEEYAEIADNLIFSESRTKKLSDNSYSLSFNKIFTYQGQPFVRSYAEGGLSAHNYAWNFTTHIKLFFTRLILSTLDKKRKEVFEDDKKFGVTAKEKAKTLVIEWSGANDLITVNDHLTDAAVEKAVAARIKNVEEMIKKGYRHFVLFNLPDLGLTPRYHGKADQDKATECSKNFNRRIQEELDKLKLKHASKQVTMDLFDVFSEFTTIYNDPEKYGFDPAKRTEPYTSSADFKIEKDKTSPAPGYPFWDDVHPTANLQAALANIFYMKNMPNYNLHRPRVHGLLEPANLADKNKLEKSLVKDFIIAYNEQLQTDRNGFFGWFRRSRIPTNHCLSDLIYHALYENGHRSFEVMKSLGWFNDEKQVIPKIPALIKATEIADAKYYHEATILSDDSHPKEASIK